MTRRRQVSLCRLYSYLFCICCGDLDKVNRPVM